MKLDVTDLTYDPVWFDLGDARLNIRPFPASKSDVIFRNGSLVISGENQYEIFSYCLVDWENVVGADNKPLPCTDEVKQKVYDFQMGGIPLFVLKIVRGFDKRKADQEKNS
ncbi:MAG: hypothetical protein JRF50_12920 [Deltaproteobacteria bacterium]|nr:hypothetical protein [Deltaproteobacteria bacterium]